MKPFSILLIRLLGLYLFLNTLFSLLPALLGPNVGERWYGELLPVLVATVAVPMVGGVLLWCFAGRLAGKLHGEVEEAGRVKDDDLVRAGTFLIGFTLVVRHVGMLVAAYSAAGAVAYDALFVVAAGLGMMLGGGTLLALYRRIKYLGLDR
ncbi:hypothetical protein [Halomonas rhizosphaerae]|uniref:DUF2975 domain-containing protein n=1 Tax=Halomonas rhizosphaerae TaxID=3043296 RepID=A0ABT6V5V3_9GAMM|nr:hypothetical protein [Halomonas rhizosphaerae]MDI5892327.1 hypothetical protein [Halomonas rhizosphaerae]MDI5920038.1 hypothetical protein [Halomonas rhizosphaerae]